MKRILVLLIATCSMIEIRNSQCQVACKYLMYESGFYDKNDCICYDAKRYASVVDKKITRIFKKTGQLQHVSPATPDYPW